MKWRWLILPIIVALSGCTFFVQSEMEADDIPLKVGTRYETYVNDPDQTPDVPVSIKTRGPWDFSKGPTDVVLKSVIVQKSQATDRAEFPRAQLAEKILPGSMTDDFTVYNFARLEEKGLLLYGQSSSPKVPEFLVRKYSGPERLLVLPLKVGTRWTDTFEVSRHAPQTVTADKRVVSQGTVTVPAGVFRGAFLIRVKRTVKETNVTTRQFIYIWWAPDVGPVAWIIGPQDGAKEIFSRADYFFRLKSYKIPD